MKVPLDLRSIITKKELRYSLGTGNLSDAKNKARLMAGQVQLFFKDIQRGRLTDMKLSSTQIYDMIKKFRDRLLQEYDKPAKSKQHMDEQDYKTWASDEDAVLGSIDVLDDKKAEYNIKILSGDYDEAEPEADRLLIEEGITESDIDKTSTEYDKLCAGIYRAKIYDFNHQQKRLRGEYSDELEEILEIKSPEGTAPIQQGATPEPVKSSKTLSQVRDAYFAEGDSEKRWADDKSRDKPWKCLQILIDYFNDGQVNTITRDMVIQFKTDLWKLPPNMNRSKKFKEKDIHEIIAMEPKPTIMEQTVSDYFGWTKSLFEYAEDIREINHSPARNMTVKKTKRPHESRQIFKKADLKQLFTAPEYSDETFKHSYQFWTPIIALYTGARQNEIAQLHLSDFQKFDDLWCININDDGDKKLKNLSSKRIIPLHPFLVEELGIIKWQEELRAKGKIRFFPELSRGRDGYGKNVSRWFNETFRISCGITKESKKVFHSFRHTFATNLAHNDINDHSLKALLGHSESGVTFEFYVKPGTAQKLCKALVDHLDYGIDLSHLKASKYAGK